MSEQTQNRYPGVQPFRQEQEHLFFGREEDTQRLFSQVIGEKLTVLFGKSGYGKSSLIEAGLFPALAKANAKGKRHYLAVPIRFNAYTGEGDLLMNKYRFHQQQLIAGQGIEKLPNLPELPPTLWGDWKRFALATNTVLVLAFDQFEEFFTYPLAQQEAFSRQLAELLYTSFPQFLEEHEDELEEGQYAHLSQPLEVRALFAIRSDRLSELNSLVGYLPAILHKRVELGPLQPTQARKAITGPAMFGSKKEEKAWLAEHKFDFNSPPFAYTEEALNRLLLDLQRSNMAGQEGVEAFLLQVLCNEIENSVQAGDIKDIDNNGLPDVRVEDLPDVGAVFSQYYNRRLQSLGVDEREVARKVIENGLVQINDAGEGRRLSVDGGALLNNYGKLGLTESLLEQLLQTYLLRREPNTLGGLNYELSHDTLLEPVVTARKAREAQEQIRLRDEQLAEERRKSRVANTRAAIGFVLAVIAIIAVFIAFNKTKLAEQKTLEAEQKSIEAAAAEERAKNEADAARISEERATKALKDFQQAQADKVIAEVDNILNRARQMRARGYGAQYRDLLRQALRVMEGYEENPFIAAKKEAVEALLR